MGKVQDQTGISLADTYDVKGSVAEIEELQTRDISLVHEMGGTIFSERLSSAIRRMESGAITQSSNFDIVINDTPATPSRILSVAVYSLTSSPALVSHVNVAVRHEAGGREVPIYTWDSTVDAEVLVRLQDNNTGVQVVNLHRPAIQQIPGMLIGSDQRQQVAALTLRGRTLGFGAGTVNIVAVIQLAFSHVGGISSFGLPIPGW